VNAWARERVFQQPARENGLLFSREKAIRELESAKAKASTPKKSAGSMNQNIL